MDQELIAYLDERFERIDGRFKRVEERLDTLDTAIRHTNVLVEGLRGDVHLIAEGFIGLNDRFNTRPLLRRQATVEVSIVGLDPALHLVEGPTRSNRRRGRFARHGVSIIRNPLITSFATKELPYRGIGTGIRRALAAVPELVFETDPERNLFTAIIPRKAS